jgi:hypothetical protein
MSEQSLYDNMAQLGQGIEACLERGLQRPALVLLYSAIDVTAQLANDDPQAGVGKRYREWVDRYLLRAKPLPCTAADLYAARCGLVHTLTPDSDMSNNGKARLVCYAWGARDADALQELTVRAGMGDRYVCVQIEQLYEAWRLGLGLLLDEMRNDPALAHRVYAKADKFFDATSTPTLDRLIEVARDT